MAKMDNITFYVTVLSRPEKEINVEGIILMNYQTVYYFKCL